MKIFLNKKRLIEFINKEKNLGFVPTMGAIHLGHISLIKRSIYECNKTLVSIFINKPQFNKKSDFIKYPRSLKEDIKILKKLKVDYLFIPNYKQMYPDGINKKIKVSAFSNQLCGRDRPGHFKAVIDIIDRFIKIIKPNKIYLGKKDFQQFKIVQHFFKNEKINVKIIGCKTIREKKGIPYSSRNLLLTKNNTNIASKVYRLIKRNKNYIIKNKTFLKKIKNQILNLDIEKLEYLKLIDVNKIIKPFKKKKNYRIFIAYYLGSVRLIDNI